MGFSHLYILQLKPWLRGLGSPDLDSKPDLFDLLIFDFLLLLLPPDLLLQHLHSLAFEVGANTPNYVDPTRRCNFPYAPQLLQTQAKPSLNRYAKMTPTSTSIDRAKMISASSIICIWLSNSSAKIISVSTDRAKVTPASSTTY